MHHITIKEVSVREHYRTLAGFMHELHKNEHNLFDKTAQWPDIETSYMRHIIAMQEECEGLCLIAYHNDSPAGFLFGFLEEQDDSRFEIYEGKQLYISDGYIDPKYRRQGIYHQLNTYIENYFISRGIKRITRLTLVNNTGMRSLLENEGYAATRLLYEKWIE